MKQSAFHDSHGLNGSLRLTSTGESFNFQFPKGENRLHVQCNVGGHVSDAYLVVEKNPMGHSEDPRDMRLTLIVQGAPAYATLDPVNQAIDAVKSRDVVREVASMTVSAVVDAFSKTLPSPDIDGMPNTPGDIHEQHPDEPREKVVLAGDLAPRKEGWETPNPVQDLGFSTRPQPVDPLVYPKAPGRPLSAQPTVSPSQNLETSIQYGPGPENPGNVDRSVQDGMVRMGRFYSDSATQKPQGSR
jgi:hypothetical protein